MRLTPIEPGHIAGTPVGRYARVHADEGIIGTGDTFMMAEGIAGYIHGRAAPKLLGRDPLEIQRIWTMLYDRDAARFGGQGLEVRAISAIDVALWDILGQSVGKPLSAAGRRVARPAAHLQHLRRAGLGRTSIDQRPVSSTDLARRSAAGCPGRPVGVAQRARGARPRVARRRHHGHEDLALR
ncbi:MAG: hypothetical protein LH650_13020 [Chloroflexi bacterium]|nr:hypothetical protein [Chloroflexota bacterium]